MFETIAIDRREHCYCQDMQINEQLISKTNEKKYTEIEKFQSLKNYNASNTTDQCISILSSVSETFMVYISDQTNYKKLTTVY